MMSRKIHILGICGTFMGGIATLAQQRGDTVSGIDSNVYPPMSLYLESLGIQLKEGYSPENLDTDADEIILGNVMSRGNPVLEKILREDIEYSSGPQWLAKNVLRQKHRLVVAGTHGKTTTSSMLAWILEYAGLNPGFLIGGIPENFGVSARFTDSQFFVVEGDEYDTAFCDKRSKFVHYRPHTLVCNNLEFDHSDIFPDISAIQKQFSHMIRLVPDNGLMIYNPSYDALREVMDANNFAPKACFSRTSTDWHYVPQTLDFSSFEICFKQHSYGVVTWCEQGEHNAQNAIAAVAAARHVGVEVSQAIEALHHFKGVKRRLQLRGEVRGVKVYDDFAHHPTAIKMTLDTVKTSCCGKVIAILEPRSNSMKSGIHQDILADAFASADHVFFYKPEGLTWNIEDAFRNTTVPVSVQLNVSDIVSQVVETAAENDKIVVMSNGSFEDIHTRIIDALHGA